MSAQVPVGYQQPTLTAVDHFAGTGWGVACHWLGIREYGVEIMPAAIRTRSANGFRTIRTNCTRDNVAWGTHADNMQDVVRNGNNFEANKTHCPKGHPYDDENTIYRKVGHRVCRTCMISYHRARRARIRAEES